MKRLEGIKHKYETFSEDHPATATIGEAAVVFALRYGLEKAGDKVGVPLGHGRRDRSSRTSLIEQHPVAVAGAVTFLAPITEELLFRELPARLIERKGYVEPSLESKKVKLAVGALFAASHAGPDAIPLPQFISGLNYSRIHEKRGLKYSMLAHVANNTLAAARFASRKKQ